MNARLSPPDARPADTEASGKPMAIGTRKAQPGSEGGMRTVAQGSGGEASNKAAERIAIRALTDAELAHEAKTMRRKASYAQGMAAKLEREIKRRRRRAREAINEANKGKSHA